MVRFLDIADRRVQSLALLVQILLSLDRRDVAMSTYQTAKKIGNDSTLVQVMEAWIGLKTVRQLIFCYNLDPLERRGGGAATARYHQIISMLTMTSGCSTSSSIILFLRRVVPTSSRSYTTSLGLTCRCPSSPDSCR